MGTDTTIAWTDATLNLVYGCRRVDNNANNGACYNCYIFRNLPKYGVNPDALTYLSVKNARKKLKAWSKDPSIRRIFPNNYSDGFHEDIPFSTIDVWHEHLFEAFPNFQFQMLTKRIGRAMLYYRRKGYVPDNVWVGTTIGARDRLKRLEQLRQIDARIRWVSAEPLLEDLGEFSLDGIQWVVVGGESGFHPRPMEPEWAENVIRIARRDGAVPFFKQIGGKGFDGAGGCVLNGREIKEWPAA